MNRLMDFFGDTVKEAVSTETQRKIADYVPSERVENDPFPGLVSGKVFEAGKSYFGVRLAGLHLVDSKRFLVQMLPLCVCMAEFNRGGETYNVPFAVGPDVIRQRLNDAGLKDIDTGKPAWIELSNLTIVKPSPVTNANLSRFLGLYSVPGDDLVKTVLNLMGDISQSVGGALGPAVQVVNTVYGGFTSLIGLSSVTPLAQALNGRALPGTGSGYFVIGSASAESLQNSQLAVKNGRLHRQKNGSSKEVTDFDYCLVALEHYDTVMEKASAMAPDLFGEPWRAVLTALAEGQSEVSLTALRRLQGRILASPDLTEPDREALIAGYMAMYQKFAASPIGTRAGTRAGGPVDIAGAVSAVDSGQTKLISDELGVVYGAITKASQSPIKGGKAIDKSSDDELTIGVTKAAVKIKQELSKKRTSELPSTAPSLAETLVRATYIAGS